MHLHDIQREVAETNRANGWHDRWQRIKATDPEAAIDHVLAKLALIGTEESEAVEDVRIRGAQALAQPRYDGEVSEAGIAKPEGIASELADVVIRAVDLAGMLGVNIEAEVLDKIEYNATRGKHHGGKAA